jgi:hypothetical protein
MRSENRPAFEQNREALRQWYLRLTEDESWNILMLEYKLFAIRHPWAKKRLQQPHQKSNPRQVQPPRPP